MFLLNWNNPSSWSGVFYIRDCANKGYVPRAGCTELTAVDSRIVCIVYERLPNPWIWSQSCTQRCAGLWGCLYVCGRPRLTELLLLPLASPGSLKTLFLQGCTSALERERPVCSRSGFFSFISALGLSYWWRIVFSITSGLNVKLSQTGQDSLFPLREDHQVNTIPW